MKGLIQAARDVPEREIFGRVVAVRGLLVEVAGPLGAMAVGGRIDIEVGPGRLVPCEVVGFANDRALLMPFATLEGVRRGCKALVGSDHAGVHPNHAWLGRVINAMGEPVDGKGPLPEGPLLYPFRNA